MEKTIQEYAHLLTNYQDMLDFEKYLAVKATSQFATGPSTIKDIAEGKITEDATFSDDIAKLFEAERYPFSGKGVAQEVVREQLNSILNYFGKVIGDSELMQTKLSDLNAEELLRISYEHFLRTVTK
ncbi:MAG: hypothetical protein ATN36_05900 [Epulopiscium sp. Nele67-Bin005]|nr:MAG: hypothetical protein ATN36_05900 [Epulopiscium sp. Nele67-Bin005]